MDNDYFLIAVSTKHNLDVCLKYALAGFPATKNGFWTFCEVEEGDVISFLYGARIFNLYKVKRKIAVINVENDVPWEPLKFNTYIGFPFRLLLQPLRKLNEPMVRQEFSYIAENLLLRGGYRKTHFQADMATFYAVSQMGQKMNVKINYPPMKYEKINPQITFQNFYDPPHYYKFDEHILQALVRKYLKNKKNLQEILDLLGKGLFAEDFEILGEKALPEGHIDLFIKDKHPKGFCRKIVVEVKKSACQRNNISQLISYMNVLGDECIGGFLVCQKFSKSILKIIERKNQNIIPLTYDFKGLSTNKRYIFKELLEKIKIEAI